MSESFRNRLLAYMLNDSIPAQAVKSAWSGLTYPGDVLAGKAPPDDIGRALETGGLAAVGNVAQAAAAKPKRFLASTEELEHDPPKYPQRPFEADYPNGAVADETGRLQHDIEGRPLTARYVAGRVQAGHPDQGLLPAELEDIIERTTGSVSFRRPRTEIDGASGGTFFDLNTREPRAVVLADDLHPNDVPRVLGHETGHVIDETVGNIPVDGVDQQLRQNYNTLIRGGRQGKTVIGPEDVGYPADQAGPELIAEGMRAYFQDPNYMKTVAPDAAARIRAYVNANPKLKDIIQFNSIGAAGLIGTGLYDWQPPAKQVDDRFGALYRAGRGA